MRRVDPFPTAADVELAYRAVVGWYGAVQCIHAAGNDVVALR
jgi:hypothetical protein